MPLSLPLEFTAQKENKLDRYEHENIFFVFNCNVVALFTFLQCPVVANCKARWSIDSLVLIYYIIQGSRTFVKVLFNRSGSNNWSRLQF